MIILLAIYVLIAAAEAPVLVRGKQWRELAAFAVFYLISFSLGLLYVLDIPIPSPMRAIAYLLEDVMHLKY